MFASHPDTFHPTDLGGGVTAAAAPAFPSDTER
jgi:hypothetical protein